MLSLMDFINPWLMGLALNAILLGIVAILPKKLLTLSGILNAGLLGIIIWGTLGWQGYLVVVFYFIVGSGVTRIGMAEKEANKTSPNKPRYFQTAGVNQAKLNFSCWEVSSTCHNVPSQQFSTTD